jgi:alpha-beta hydrolase superfamily lysophospholipase
MPVIPIRIPFHRWEIAGHLHRPSPAPELPCVILCHGLLSSMESPKFRLLAEALTGRGMAALRFDFLGCGASTGHLRDTTVSRRLDELRAVLGFLRRDLGIQGPLGLLGSSMGGFISLLAFAGGRDIDAICVWATPFDPQGLSRLRAHPDLAGLGPAFFEDLATHHLARLSPRIHHLMVLHGEKDEIVPQDHARRLFACASAPKSLGIFPGGDHRFTDPGHRRQAADLSLQWLARFLFHPGGGRGSRALLEETLEKLPVAGREVELDACLLD